MASRTLNPLCTWWHDHYLHAARTAYPDVCADHNLAVGWKITHVTGTSSHNYYWPLVNGDHDLPVLHEATDWDPKSKSECPSRPGDGLCLIPWDAPVREATSGGVRFAQSIGHVLVYPKALSRGTDGKRRAPWVMDVDCFDPVWACVAGGAYLSRANLSGADLSRADLYGANLSGANLSRADLSRANADKWTRWPACFDPTTRGVIVRA